MHFDTLKGVGRSWALVLAITFESGMGQAQPASTNTILSTAIGQVESDPGLVQVQLDQARRCAFNLSRIHMSLELSAIDHEGHYPSNLLALSLLKGHPECFVCPADTNHVIARSGKPMSVTNVGYQFRMAAEQSTSEKTNVLLVCPIHQVTVFEDGTSSGGILAPANIDRSEWTQVNRDVAQLTPPQKEALELAKMTRAQQTMCDTHLRQILLAVDSYAGDHAGTAPKSFMAIRDALGTPLVVTCPADAYKTGASGWKEYLPEKNLSYQLLPVPQPLPEGDTNLAVILCPVHGRAVFSDGKVRPRGMPRPGSGKPLPKA